MGAVLASITPELPSFIEGQRVFFVATAPSGSGGHINVSPKGLDTFRLLTPTRVAYLDLTGSGNETAAHVAHNGRITFMFCSFSRARRPFCVCMVGGKSCCPATRNGPIW